MGCQRTLGIFTGPPFLQSKGCTPQCWGCWMKKRCGGELCLEQEEEEGPEEAQAGLATLQSRGAKQKCEGGSSQPRPAGGGGEQEFCLDIDLC